VIVPDAEARESGLPVIRYTSFDADIGRFLVTRSERGLRSVRFAKSLDVERALGEEVRGQRVVAVEDRLTLRRVADSIRDYLAGRPHAFDWRLDLERLSDFGRSVLEATRRIPYGTLRSYKSIAHEIGSPRATRPVGQALARNPLPIVIPCHRVVNSDGTLGGYSGGGPDMKRRLIAIETGQIGLALGGGARETRERIRFLLDSEAGQGDEHR